MDSIKQKFEKAKSRVHLNALTVQGVKKYLSVIRDMADMKPDQRAQVMEQLPHELRVVVDEYGMDKAAARISRALELDMYRPRDLPIFEFIMSPNLESVEGEFSTFNSKLARMMRDGADDDILRKYAYDNTHNLVEVSVNLLRAFTKSVDKHRDLFDSLCEIGANVDVKMWNKFFITIASDVGEQFNIPDDVGLYVRVIDSLENAPQDIRDRHSPDDKWLGYEDEVKLSTKPGMKYHEICINRKNIIELFEKKNGRAPGGVELMRTMMSTFAHEFGHFIDKAIPNRGAVGPQKMSIAKKTHVGFEESKQAYRQNPTEKSSYELTGIFESLFMRSVIDK